MRSLINKLSFVALFLAVFSFNAMAQADKVEITIESNDRMQFNLSELNVEEGQTVVLTLKHTGRLPVTAMGHNWVLLTKGTEISKFGVEAAKARENEYIPADTDQVIAHTALIGGGEETTVEFTAPAAGEYNFICSFPGHYGMMKGKLVVKSSSQAS